MFSTGHLTSGIAVGLAVGLEGPALAAFVLASVFTDLDYVVQVATGRNHRTLLTHSPLFHIAILGPLGWWFPLAWAALGGSLLHLSLDLWEYGIRLNPFTTRIYGFRLIPGIERMRFSAYLGAYFADRRFLGAEILFFLVAVALGIARVLG